MKHIGTNGFFEIKLSDLRKIIKSLDDEDKLPKDMSVMWGFPYGKIVSFKIVNHRKNLWKLTKEKEFGG